LKISNETKIGALTVISLAILILGYSFLRGNDVFTTENKFYALYNDVSGLTVSKPVLINGFQIGRVAKMELQASGQTLVEFKVKGKYEIPDNTIAKLESTDLLGGKAIVFDLGTSKKMAGNTDTLQAFVKGGLAESLQPVQKKAEVIIAKMDSILTSVNAIMNPRFQANVDRSFNSIANTLQALEGVSQKADALVGREGVHINTILTNVESISSTLKTSNQYLSGTLQNFNKVSADVANGNLKQTLDNANKAMADLQATIAQLNNGKGSVGLLLHDDKLYRNLASASAHLDSLFIDVKAHPKSYVSFSVFGGKKKD
jgi:phospholipid/cholesterol/gamma-HCH transport system substrate-binding protein